MGDIYRIVGRVGGGGRYRITFIRGWGWYLHDLISHNKEGRKEIFYLTTHLSFPV